MLPLKIPPRQLWDETNEVFIDVPGAALELEHSLVSLSKWEAEWQKPFLGYKDKTRQETLDYVRCMTLSPEAEENVYRFLDDDQLRIINDYINRSMTATWFREKENKPFSKRIVTSEVIYYWMFALDIPIECEYWHLNRLLTLIRVCNEKNNPPKKLGKKEAAKYRSSLNASRRKARHSKG